MILASSAEIQRIHQGESSFYAIFALLPLYLDEGV
jgi:hypothetical protein